MNLNDYFDAVSIERPNDVELEKENIVGKNITIHTPNEPIPAKLDYQVALMGVPEDKNAVFKGCVDGADQVRNKLYTLFISTRWPKIIDLGNLKKTESINDSYYGLRDVCNYLRGNNIVPVIIGGSHDLLYALHLSFQDKQEKYQWVNIDARMDMISEPQALNSRNFLNKIFQERDVLGHYTHIGHQVYYTDQQDTDRLKDMMYDYIRLGEIRNDLKEIEPYLRYADMVSFDLNAIKQAEAPAHPNPSPNGFSGEEACQISRYAGISDTLKYFGIFELYPRYDLNGQTASLVSQMLWYFIDGFSQRKSEYPDSYNENFTRYIVNMNDMDHEMTFIKSHLTERWWFEIPDLKKEDEEKVYIPCSHNDYLMACNQEIPERWWRAFQKIN